jgi:cation diffusion facilitator family transporter
VIDRNRLTLGGIALSVFLFAAKTYAGVTTGSIAILSDSLNSLLDVFSYTTVMIAVRVQRADPDEGHQFGHRRAEPLAGLVIAVLAAVLGFTVVRDSIAGIARGTSTTHDSTALAVVLVSMGAKAVMWLLYRQAGRSTGSVALEAAAVDSRNDVLTSSVVLLGYVAGGRWDSVAGLAIGIWILVSGVQIGLQNTGYLLGKSPSKEFSDRVRSVSLSVAGVTGVNDVRAHFVGDIVQVEVHIEVPGDMDVRTAHDIGMDVQNRLLEIPSVGSVFVHIDVEGDPVRLPFSLG